MVYYKLLAAISGVYSNALLCRSSDVFVSLILVASGVFSTKFFSSDSGCSCDYCSIRVCVFFCFSVFVFVISLFKRCDTKKISLI